MAGILLFGMLLGNVHQSLAFHVSLAPLASSRPGRSAASPLSPSVSPLRMMAAGQQEKKKVVVTGVGAVSSVGVGADNFFQALVDGKSGIATMPSWADQYPCKVGSVVSEKSGWHGPEEWMDARDAKNCGRFAHFGMAASKIAIKDAGLDVTKMDQERLGVIVGSGTGAVDFFEDNVNRFMRASGGKAGMDMVSQGMIPSLVANTASGIIGLEIGAKGPNYGCTSACASGTHALGDALFLLQSGQADVMIAGGTEASITPLSFAGFAAMRAMVTTMNDDPLRASMPFDKKRAGFVMGEGAGVLVLETEEHALARGAPIVCELAGYGATCDAHHITAPHPEGRGLAAAISMALKSGGVDGSEVDYINAHGTSTPYNDKFETMAIKKALGLEAAKKTKISSTKSMIGHCLGGAGGLEAVVTAKTVQTGWIPPTLNLEEPDLEDGCDLDYTPNKAVKVDLVRAAITDNLGFGGHNAALVFKHYPQKE
eukprot:CAMPEP_0181298374 /NCGR_PEP_ID=MMETSP1101-20121128/5746_1 /TAXON_ID=46948 /ORGANISM="Rhodomonas abbreviata, Strain Caron Lab Isolate" /LENGTH=483 /DNA_ID=CAMNT_0023403387 /DNA_START=39 /DNA_END=1490 /DNA_ORIENTATION=+